MICIVKCHNFHVLLLYEVNVFFWGFPDVVISMDRSCMTFIVLVTSISWRLATLVIYNETYGKLIEIWIYIIINLYQSNSLISKHIGIKYTWYKNNIKIIICINYNWYDIRFEQKNQYYIMFTPMTKDYIIINIIFWFFYLNLKLILFKNNHHFFLIFCLVIFSTCRRFPDNLQVIEKKYTFLCFIFIVYLWLLKFLFFNFELKYFYMYYKLLDKTYNNEKLLKKTHSYILNQVLYIKKQNI